MVRLAFLPKLSGPWQTGQRQSDYTKRRPINTGLLGKNSQNSCQLLLYKIDLQPMEKAKVKQIADFLRDVY
jgi:hypothetical protein